MGEIRPKLKLPKCLNYGLVSATITNSYGNEEDTSDKDNEKSEEGEEGEERNHEMIYGDTNYYEYCENRTNDYETNDINSGYDNMSENDDSDDSDAGEKKPVNNKINKKKSLENRLEKKWLNLEKKLGLIIKFDNVRKEFK